MELNASEYSLEAWTAPLLLVRCKRNRAESIELERAVTFTETLNVLPPTALVRSAWSIVKASRSEKVVELVLLELTVPALPWVGNRSRTIPPVPGLDWEFLRYTRWVCAREVEGAMPSSTNTNHIAQERK
jgi:hypothetical protein